MSSTSAPSKSISDGLISRWIQHRDHHHRFLISVFGEAALAELLASFEGYTGWERELPEGSIITLGVKAGIALDRLWPTRSRRPLSWSSARAQLGGSEAALIVNAEEGIEPDALAAAFGAVSGGGVIIMYLPLQPPVNGLLKEKLSVWPHGIERVQEYLWTHLWNSLQCRSLFSRASHQIFTSIQPNHSGRTVSASSPTKIHTQDEIKPSVIIELPVIRVNALRAECLNRDQWEGVLTILQSHQREAFTAVALQAHRGRGKSSTLGVAAAALLFLGEREIAITAPDSYAVDSIFKRAEAVLIASGVSVERDETHLFCSLGSLIYHPPQDLWTRRVRPRILFVDEAAALPVPLLERLLESRPSLVFATTTHGYEGTGRGFSLRFRPFLQRKLRKLYEPQLTLPLRWGHDDPSEGWLMSSLLLDVDLSPRGGKAPLSAYRYRVLTGSELSQDWDLTREVFALLVHAHYRTQPSDLWRMLDAPNLTVHCLERLLNSNEEAQLPRLLSAALVSSEGGLPAELAARIFEGRERPRGQLFAANFAVHLNREIGATLQLRRIVRIATRPSEQGRGAGQALLKEIEIWANREGADLIGSSFGATEQLTRFWLRAGYTPLRLGVRQSHVSGERSLLVARGLSPRGVELVHELESEYAHDLGEQLRGVLSSIDPALVYTLSAHLGTVVRSKGSDSTPLQLSRHQWSGLAAVAFAGRAYELASTAAHRLTLHWVMHEASSPDSPAPLAPLGRLLITKVLQGQSWLEVTADAQLGSPSEAMKGISAALRLLFLHFAPAWAVQEARRFPYFDRDTKLCSELLPPRLTVTSGA